MEVQEQREREDSRREQEFQTLELAENGPVDSIEEEDRNVLTLTGTGGSSIINISLTSSLQSDNQPRAPKQGGTMSLSHPPWEERGTDTPNSAKRRSDNSTPLIQLQRERVRHHQELHHLDQ